MGQTSSKNEEKPQQVIEQNPKREIREADRLVIDASSLACPVCFEVFGQAPYVFQCGHSFCRECAPKFVKVERGQNENRAVIMATFFECPYCRRRTTVNAKGDHLASPNFAMETVLDAVQASAIAALENENVEPMLRLHNKRLMKELSEKNRLIDKLKRDADKSSQKIKHWQMLSSFLVTLAFFLFTKMQFIS